MSGPDRQAAIAGLASLDGPVRRRMYEYISDAGRPVSREEAAGAAGITRMLAAYHLDKLAEQELAVSVPPRAYELLARLLAEAAESDTTGRVRSTLNGVARSVGHQAG